MIIGIYKEKEIWMIRNILNSACVSVMKTKE